MAFNLTTRQPYHWLDYVFLYNIMLCSNNDDDVLCTNIVLWLCSCLQHSGPITRPSFPLVPHTEIIHHTQTEYDENIAARITRRTVCVCECVRGLLERTNVLSSVNILLHTLHYTCTAHTYITILYPYLSLFLDHNKMTNDTNKLCSLYLFFFIFPLLDGKLTNYIYTDRNMFS